MACAKKGWDHAQELHFVDLHSRQKMQNREHSGHIKSQHIDLVEWNLWDHLDPEHREREKSGGRHHTMVVWLASEWAEGFKAQAEQLGKKKVEAMLRPRDIWLQWLCDPWVFLGWKSLGNLEYTLALEISYSPHQQIAHFHFVANSKCNREFKFLKEACLICITAFNFTLILQLLSNKDESLSQFFFNFVLIFFIGKVTNAQSCLNK